MKDKTDKEKELIAKVQPLSEDLHCSEEGKEQYKIGELYRRGWKVFKDENKAVDYYLHAINNANLLTYPSRFSFIPNTSSPPQQHYPTPPSFLYPKVGTALC